MSPKKQVQISSICLAVMILLIFAFGLLVFYVPVLLENYAQTAEELSPFLKIVRLIGSVIHQTELFIAPLIFLAFIVSLIWRIQSSIKLRQLEKISGNSDSV